MYKPTVSLFDRIVSVLTYLTAGWAGMIVCVIMYFRKRYPSHFLRYNVFQSIFISLLLFVLALGLGLICQFLSIIPFINYLAAQISFIFNRPIFFDYSIIQLFITVLVIYTVIFSALGKYPRIYWISKIIDHASRG